MPLPSDSQDRTASASPISSPREGVSESFRLRAASSLPVGVATVITLSAPVDVDTGEGTCVLADVTAFVGEVTGVCVCVRTRPCRRYRRATRNGARRCSRPSARSVTPMRKAGRRSCRRLTADGGAYGCAGGPPSRSRGTQLARSVRAPGRIGARFCVYGREQELGSDLGRGHAVPVLGEPQKVYSRHEDGVCRHKEQVGCDEGDEMEVELEASREHSELTADERGGRACDAPRQSGQRRLWCWHATGESTSTEPQERADLIAFLKQATGG
eukprot:ctg_434.g225